MRAAGRQSRRQCLRLDDHEYHLRHRDRLAMRRKPEKIAACFRALVVLATLTVSAPFPRPATAESQSVTESIAIAGSVSNSTITNTVNHENPETLALLREALADKNASEEKRRLADAKVSELSTKLGFTSAAVVEFFKILGDQDVPDEKIPVRLIEIATHFSQTRDALKSLEPDDPKAAALAASAKQALDGGRLAEADRLLDQAKEIELAALRQAREFKQKAQRAEDRHALNAAKLVAGQGNIALTQLRYREAAQHFKDAVELVPASHPNEVVPRS